MASGLRSVLERLARGELTPRDAERAVRAWAVESLGEKIKLDLGREIRRGLPEVVMAEGKDPGDLLRAVEAAVERSGMVLVSRVGPEHREILEGLGSRWEVASAGGVFVVKRAGFRREALGGRVGILAAGTADVPLAEEVRLILEEVGCETVTSYDVGVACPWRTLEAVKLLLDADVDVIVAVAGMEGMLPSFVASLVDVLVIGLPSPVGYGVGGRGEAALLSMLQTCNPGLVVVNVGNSVGAAYAAAAVAARAAGGRGRGGG